jgi:hypothetical protein
MPWLYLIEWLLVYSGSWPTKYFFQSVDVVKTACLLYKAFLPS